MVGFTARSRRFGVGAAALAVVLAGAGLAWAQTSGGRGDTPLSYRPLDTACTIYASSGDSTPPERLQNGEVRPVATLADDYSLQGGNAAGCGIDPAWDVRAVDVTVSVIRPSSRGTLSVWPADGDQPAASAAQLRFDDPETTRGDVANSFVVPVAADGSGTVNVMVDSARSHIVVVLNGVYTPSPTDATGDGGGDDYVGRLRVGPSSDGCGPDEWQLALVEVEGTLPNFTSSGCSAIVIQNNGFISQAFWSGSISVLNDDAAALEGIFWDSNQLQGDYVTIGGYQYSLSCSINGDTSTFDADANGDQRNLEAMSIFCGFNIVAGYPLVGGGYPITYPTTGADLDAITRSAAEAALPNLRTAPLGFLTAGPLTGSVPPISTTTAAPTTTTTPPGAMGLSAPAFNDGFVDQYNGSTFELFVEGEPVGYTCCDFLVLNLDVDQDGISDYTTPGPFGSFNVPLDIESQLGTSLTLTVWAEWSGNISDSITGTVELRVPEVRSDLEGGFVFAGGSDPSYTVPIFVNPPGFFNDDPPNEFFVYVDTDGDGTADFTSDLNVPGLDVPITAAELDTTQTYTVWWSFNSITADPVTYDVYVFPPQI